MRVRRMSLRTEESYLYYIKCYLEFHRRRPEEMAEAEVEAFLTHLAGEKRVAASTQNVAFAALIYLYREVLGIELENVAALRAKRARRAPDVLSRDEVWRLLRQFWRRRISSSPRCFTARVCGFLKASDCASKTWISRAAP